MSKNTQIPEMKEMKEMKIVGMFEYAKEYNILNDKLQNGAINDNEYKKLTQIIDKHLIRLLNSAVVIDEKLLILIKQDLFDYMSKH